jgi:hypothetical protein
MQNIEATLVIGEVCEQLRKTRPEVPLVTIHDSVASTRANSSWVADVMRSTLGRFGITPSLKTEEPTSDGDRLIA